MKTIGFMGGKFLPFHMGHLYAILEAHNQVDKLYVVLSSSENRDQELCARDGIKYLPAEIRLSWIGEAFNDLKNLEIIHIEDDEWDSDYNWESGATAITRAIPEKITHVFSSEQHYGELFKKFYPGAKHVVLDNDRKTVNISATELRTNLYFHLNKLPTFVQSYFVQKVVVVGTESTGKSTLVTKLAKFYNTNFVHEVGRDYCEKYKNQITVKMFDSIAMKHYLLHEELTRFSNHLIFVDSEAIITQYYLKMYHNTSSHMVENIIENQHFDLWLYLEPDVDWVADGFRMQGSKKQRIMNNLTLKGMLNRKKIKYYTISGNYSERFAKARTLINNM